MLNHMIYESWELSCFPWCTQFTGWPLSLYEIHVFCSSTCINFRCGQPALVMQCKINFTDCFAVSVFLIYKFVGSLIMPLCIVIYVLLKKVLL